MDRTTIKEWVEQDNALGKTVFPTKAMRRWLNREGLVLVVELGTGKVTFKRC